MRRQHLKAVLQPAGTKTANFSGTAQDLGLSQFRVLIITLDITSAERDSADETYDIYVTTSDGVSSWDLVHFPQIATTGAKRFTARLVRDQLPQNVTTAGPGVAAVETGTMKTDTAGAGEGIKSLAAGKVRHGPWGDSINHELVVAGTFGGTGIGYSISITGAE